jgi:hypothetical protein
MNMTGWAMNCGRYGRIIHTGLGSSDIPYTSLGILTKCNDPRMMGQGCLHQMLMAS